MVTPMKNKKNVQNPPIWKRKNLDETETYIHTILNGKFVIFATKYFPKHTFPFVKNRIVPFIFAFSV
jgi:hypothetical protein